MLTKSAVINNYLPAKLKAGSSASAYAPSNIALCKYWGKRNLELNLPTNGSLSISLGKLGTTTYIKAADCDSLSLNQQALDNDSKFARKVFAFVNLFRREQDLPLAISTENTIPTAAGLASSASGFAALMLALDKFFALNLPTNVLSAFARMGSGSACRSLHHGFVKWQAGSSDDGMDSFGEKIDCNWQQFCIGLVKIDTRQKKVNSTQGMLRTLETSQLYRAWPQQASRDLATIHQAILERDFEKLGQTAEHNAMSMHATMISAYPPLLYWQAKSIDAMEKVWQLRADNIPVYFTMDAGPNLKLLFCHQQQSLIEKQFANIEIIRPFAALADK